MRFLLVGSFALSLLKFRRNLIEALIAKGFDVHVALPIAAEDEWIVNRLEDMGVTIDRITMARTGMNPIGDLLTLFKLWRLMREIRPSHVLSYTIKPVVYGSLAARFSGVPKCYALITGLGYAFEEAKGRGRLRGLAQRMYKLALGQVDAVIFQNPDDEALFLDRGLVAEGTPTYVANGSGVDLDEFPVAPLPGNPSFLMIARLLGAKGVREFVSAARLVRNSGSNAAFKIVGWRDHNPDAVSVQELEAWKAEGIVEFLGKQVDVRPAIKLSSVYVLPSYREGTPRTVLEAMSMGRPIITTDAPGCREPVSDGENGFLVPVGSAEALALAMLRFVDNPSLIATMGRRSREIAEERYDVHKVNEVMLKEMGIG